MSSTERHKEIGQPDPVVHGGIVVHLRRGPQKGYGGHEAGQQGEGHGNRVHVPSRHQKRLCVIVSPVFDGKE